MTNNYRNLKELQEEQTNLKKTKKDNSDSQEEEDEEPRGNSNETSVESEEIVLTLEIGHYKASET